MRLPLVLLASACSTIALAQPDPDSILVGNRPRPKVLLVGTFHFEYYDLDAHVTAKEKRVNVKEPKRQQEMQELIDHIARFKPCLLYTSDAADE